jgi:co-chaperonin GroES (HSP10)
MKVKFNPIDYRVLVLPDKIDDTLGEGILVKAEETKVADRRTATQGVVVKLSKYGYVKRILNSILAILWCAEFPKVGDRVEFSMYSGQFYKEEDVEYRILNDADIIGILKE